MQENKLKNYLLLHVIVFIWGFTAILGALISIDSIPLVWYRMSLATVFLLIYILLTKKPIRSDVKSIFMFLFTGVIIAFHWIFFFEAIKVSNVSVAVVTLSTGAFFTSLIEPIFFRRRIKGVEIFLGLFVIIGLYIIFNFEKAYRLGIIYGLIASFLSSLFAVLNGLFIKKHEAEKISIYQLFFGALFITVYLALKNDFSISFFMLEKSDWGYLLLLSTFCTAYAFMASVKIMKFISPFTVMLTVNLEPIYAIVFALFIFGDKEKMNTEFYLGTFIVLFVVLLNGMIKNKLAIKNKILPMLKRKK